MSTETLHFTVGADFGIRLMEIANEHLLYANDLDKAMKVFTDSFGGDVPEELVKQLLSGEMLILVDEENQMFDIVERSKYMHLDKLYPPQIDFNKFIADKQEELDNGCDNLDKNLDIVINKFRYKDTYRIDVPIESLMKYIYGNDDELIADIKDEFEYDDDVQQIKQFIRVTRDFIEKSMKLSQMISRLVGMYEIKTSFDTYELTNLAGKVQDIAKANFTMFNDDNNTLNAYLEASKEIDEVIEKGIEPVDIMDNYTAGWLSPQGEYYALNGEIANMLHNQIADALQVKGRIPKYENNDTDREEINPDAWLEQQGWVKIHGNNIQFGGCLNSKIDKTNVNMTEKQIEIILNYITDCHTCIIKAGWKLEKTSIGMFTSMGMSDPIALNKRYFSYD